MNIPHMFDNSHSGEHTIFIAQEIFKQSIFLIGQINFRVAAPNPIGDGIEPQIGDRQPCRGLCAPPTEQRANPGQ